MQTHTDRHAQTLTKQREKCIGLLFLPHTAYAHVYTHKGKHTHILYTHARLTIDTGGRLGGLKVPSGFHGQTSEGGSGSPRGGSVSQVERRDTRES